LEPEALKGLDVDLVVVEAAEEAGRLARNSPELLPKPLLKAARAKGARGCSGAAN
jgi:hypothetical protein